MNEPKSQFDALWEPTLGDDLSDSTIPDLSPEAELYDRYVFANRLSGGELPPDQRETFLHLSRLIKGAPDVHALVAMEPAKLGGPGYYYMIETVFPTFPRFVIGLTDELNERPQVLFQSGAQWSAQEAWEIITRGGMP